MIQIQDIAYVRFGAPDLDEMEKFAADFGLAVTSRDEDRLYLRGTDPAPYVHVTERGEAGFRGVAFAAASAEDMHAAAKMDGASGLVAKATAQLAKHDGSSARGGSTPLLRPRLFGGRI